MNWFALFATALAVAVGVISCENKDNLEEYTIEDFGESQDEEKKQNEDSQ